MTEVARIALDAMGGDHAPSEVVKGALLAAAELPVEIILVGQEDVVRKELAAASSTTLRNIEVFDAREVVTMEDTALAPLRRKRNCENCPRLQAFRRLLHPRGRRARISGLFPIPPAQPSQKSVSCRQTWLARWNW